MRSDDDDLDDEAWDIRETFAYFGLAFYHACVLEVGLAHTLLFGEFMIRARDQIAETKGVGFDRKQYEITFDAFINGKFAQTMGNVIKQMEALPDFNDALKARIKASKQRRDFLAHHYWRERDTAFATAEGRAAMRKELKDDADTFRQLDRDIDAAMKPTREKLGFNDDVFKSYLERQMERIKAGLPWDE